MRVVAPSARLSRLVALAAAILVSLTAHAQTSPTSATVKTERAINLLVLGDSISWGQGLKDEHKAWFLVKKWLQQNTGREVLERIEAHSGAVIGTPNQFEPPSFSDLNGELSRAYP